MFRVLLESLAATLARSQTHGTLLVQGNVFENPSAPNEPTASCSGNMHARSRTATHGEFVALTQEDIAIQAHVEKKSFDEMIKDPNRKDFFEATPKLVQSWKSRLRITWNAMDLKLRSLVFRKTGLNPGW